MGLPAKIRTSLAERYLDHHFGIGARVAHEAIRADAAARAIYDCALRAVYELLDDENLAARVSVKLEFDPHATIDLPRCRTQQWSDETVCLTCGLRWDTNDEPPCPRVAT